MELQNQSSSEPVREDPSVVVGGPLDPTSAEGQPPEGHTVGGDGPTPLQTGTPSDPFYRGLTGDIKTPEEMRDYTKRLEELLVQNQARQMATPNPQPQAPTATPPAPNQASARERFAELIFSKPDEAFEISVSEAQARINQQLDGEKRKQAFWVNFYAQNPDLKRVEPIVQSVMRERTEEISHLRTEKEVSELLSRESRSRIDLVKKEFGFSETKLPSQSAIAFGGSREPVAKPPQTPQAPLNFADQIRKLRPGGKTRQA